MGMPTLVPRYTADEVRSFPDNGLRYEVIRGDLFVTPAPGTRHQRIVGEIFRRLQEYVEEHGLGEAIVSPFEVQLAEDTAVQPDVLVVLEGQAADLTRERLLGPPALVIEVISYSSKRTDRIQKRQLYQEEGVTEYWIVDPEVRRLERWRPKATSPELLNDRVTWQPGDGIPAFALNLVALFENADRGLH